MTTQKDLDAKFKEYTEAVAVAEWNIGQSTEQDHWDHADKIYIDFWLMKLEYEREQKAAQYRAELQAFNDQMAAELLDTYAAFEADAGRV